MKRLVSSVLFASVLTAMAVACDAEDSASFVSGSSGSSGSGGFVCSDFGECGTCTPQLGCGWCYLPDGTGACLSDPNECPASRGNEWTWNASGCTTASQPTVGPEAEGGTSPAVADAAISDATLAADSASSAIDGGSPASDGAVPSADAGGIGQGALDSGATATGAGGVDASTVDAGTPSADTDAADGS